MQYLNRSVQAKPTLLSSRLMFFLFTTDNESQNWHDAHLDDLSNPHI